MKGGDTPLSVNFLGTDRPLRGGRGVPPLSVKKNPFKIGPKTLFFGQKSLFPEILFSFLATEFPLIFRENLVRDGPGGGGNPY